jgi:hypothetical protein
VIAIGTWQKDHVQMKPANDMTIPCDHRKPSDHR